MGVSTGGPGGEHTTLARINVTPFVDVMLVLLVIFMVTTPMMQEMADEHSEVEMNLPTVDDSDHRVALDDVDHMMLAIDEELQIFLGDEPLVDCGPYADEEGADRFNPCFDELQSKVENNRRLQEEGRLFLLADTEIPYGVVVGSMNRVRLAGVEQVGMVTNPELRGDDDS